MYTDKSPMQAVLDNFSADQRVRRARTFKTQDCRPLAPLPAKYRAASQPKIACTDPEMALILRRMDARGSRWHR